MKALAKRPELTDLFTFFNANYPQYELVIDSDAAMQKGVSIGKAMDTLGILIGSTYEQGFILFGQFYKLYVQASPEYRRYPDDLNYLFVKNDKGEMVPYTSFMKLKKQQGLNEITRYNLYPSAAIQGSPAAGYSSGQALQAVKEVAAETLPQGYGLGWEGLSFDQANAGNEVVYIFLIVVAFVYLVLVAQYESFLLPLAVLLSLPIGICGSFISLDLAGMSNDVYAQIGLVMLVGLLGKNGILIVEFAVQRRTEGLGFREAAALRPGDGPCAIFIERCVTFLKDGLPPRWDGTWYFYLSRKYRYGETEALLLAGAAGLPPEVALSLSLVKRGREIAAGAPALLLRPACLDIAAVEPVEEALQRRRRRRLEVRRGEGNCDCARRQQSEHSGSVGFRCDRYHQGRD